MIQIKVINYTGLLAVLVRQTNIIWVGFFTIEHALNIFDRRMEQPVPSGVLSTPLHFRVSNITNYNLWRESALRELI